MHQALVMIVRILPSALGVLFGLLGFATLDQNLLGWFVFAAGVFYTAGSIISAYILRRDFDGGQTTASVAHMPARALSSWLFTGAMVAVLFLSPLEFLYLRTQSMQVAWPELAGMGLTCLGGLLFIWAQLSPSRWSAGEPSSGPGPYRVIRYPVYAGCLLIGFGLALGYASVWGSLALLLVLLPAILWRTRLEDQRLLATFGARFQEYAARTKRLIPAVW